MNNIEYLLFIGSVILVSLVISGFIRFSVKKIPRGTICIKMPDNIPPPGSRLSRSILVVGFGIGMINLLATIFLCILNIYNNLPVWIVIKLPSCIHYIFYAFVVLYYCWGILTITYNRNYTPCYRPMATEYRIATGGPYSIIKHPMYVAKGMFPLLMFFSTGFTPFLLGLISWSAIPYQARKEEEALRRIGNKEYEAYVKKTGRFFPKLSP